MGGQGTFSCFSERLCLFVLSFIKRWLSARKPSVTWKCAFPRALEGATDGNRAWVRASQNRERPGASHVDGYLLVCGNARGATKLGQKIQTKQKDAVIPNISPSSCLARGLCSQPGFC